MFTYKSIRVQSYMLWRRILWYGYSREMARPWPKFEVKLVKTVYLLKTSGAVIEMKKYRSIIPPARYIFSELICRAAWKSKCKLVIYDRYDTYIVLFRYLRVLNNNDVEVVFIQCVKFWRTKTVRQVKFLIFEYLTPHPRRRRTKM